jgi:hypothetical protein
MANLLEKPEMKEDHKGWALRRSSAAGKTTQVRMDIDQLETVRAAGASSGTADILIA